MTSAALVIGLCSHGLSVARALRRQKVDVYAVEKNLALPGAATNAVQRLFTVTGYSDAELLPALIAIRAQLPHYDQVVLFPTNDNHVRLLGEHFERLRPHYLLSWSGCIPEVLRLQKKSELGATSVARGLLYPKSAVIDALDGAAAAVAGWRYPLIIKPVRPMSSFKTRVAASESLLLAGLAQYEADLPILAQEYIAGGDDCLYFGALVLDRGRVVQGMVGRKLASHPPAQGQTTAAEVVLEPRVLALTEQFFEGSHLSGPVSLELKKGPDGSFWVIEPTVGRTDFWSELCIAAGFNQPWQEYLLALGQPVTPAAVALDVAWYDAERDMLGYGLQAWRQRTLRPYGKRAAFTYLRRDDPGPFLRSCRAALKRASRKWLSIDALGARPASLRASWREYPLGQALPAPLSAWLAQHQPHPIFATQQWFEQLAAFERERGKDCTYVWLFVLHGDTPVLAAPLAKTRAGPGQLQLELLGNFYTPGIDLFTDPAALPAERAWRSLLQAFDQLYPRWLGFWAAPLRAPQHDSLVRATDAAGRATFPLALSSNHTARIDSLAQYWAGRPSRLLNTLKRKGKLLAQQQHRFELTATPNADQVAGYWQVYQSSWKPQEPSRSFIDWLLAWSMQHGFLRLGLLYVDDAPVACQLWLVQGERAYIFKLAQDERADRFSPGSLLTEHIIEQLAQADGVRHLDFLLGDNAFKTTWMDSKEPVCGVNVVNNAHMAGRLLASWRTLRASLARMGARRRQPDVASGYTP